METAKVAISRIRLEVDGSGGGGDGRGGGGSDGGSREWSQRREDDGEGGRGDGSQSGDDGRERRALGEHLCEGKKKETCLATFGRWVEQEEC